MRGKSTCVVLASIREERQQSDTPARAGGPYNTTVDNSWENQLSRLWSTFAMISATILTPTIPPKNEEAMIRTPLACSLTIPASLLVVAGNVNLVKRRLALNRRT